jgi:hypothetical protein
VSQPSVPTRITIDFRDAAMPSRTWILGVDDGARDRIELIALERRDGVVADPAVPVSDRPRGRTAPGRRAVMLRHVECSCPDFCELDHANE